MRDGAVLKYLISDDVKVAHAEAFYLSTHGWRCLTISYISDLTGSKRRDESSQNTLDSAKADGHRCPWALATQEESLVRCPPLGRNTLSNGGRSGRWKGARRSGPPELSHSLELPSAFCESVVFQRSSQLILRCGRVGHGAISAATDPHSTPARAEPHSCTPAHRQNNTHGVTGSENNTKFSQHERDSAGATLRDEWRAGARAPATSAGTPTLSLTYWTDASIGLKQTPRYKVPVSARLRFGDQGWGATGERRMRRCRQTISR
ncbi:hypothetical protein EVAR_100781_1 [Eumeta japonica]|uniref:Uncharacterized protein n=1 Tax=Eumeta variegata TaxID=151549 RepID=A0A4C1T8P1_EUMVA|nr:hypothetical protein EVAR_100781_1 [Eumeta japonica]